MLKHLCLVSALLVLAGCSGGGDTPQAITPPDKPQEKPVPDKGTAEGKWRGSTDTGWERETTVLDDGTYYTLYTAPSRGPSGMIQGTGVSEGGVFTSANAKDFNFDNKRVLDVTIAATYTERQRLSGSIAYPGLGTVGFTDGEYDSSYDLEPSMPELPKEYIGVGIDLDGIYFDSNMELIATPGTSPEVPYAALTLRDTGARFCALKGTMTPRAHGNVFDVHMTVAVDNSDTPCPIGIQTLVGIAYFTPPRHITLLATTNERANTLVFTGNSWNQQ